MNHCRRFAPLSVVLLIACQAAPPPVAEDNLIASPGVIDYFDEPEVEQVIAGQGNDIKCERHRRVGTHLIVRVCRTRAEWAELKQQQRDDAQKSFRDRCLITPDPLCGLNP